MSSLWGFLVLEGYLLTLLLVPWVFFQRKKTSTAILAWIMAIIMLPYVGGFLFLIFGTNNVRRRQQRRRDAAARINRYMPGIPQYELMLDEVAPQVRRLTRLAERVGGNKASAGNKVELINDTNRAFGLIEQGITQSTRFINLEYYIWQPDRTGTQLRDLLIERAKAGVQIRFLYDGFGSMRIRRRFLQPMHDVGIRTAAAMPGASFRERWSINFRNHRKIVLCDGQVAFTGGMNVGDDYRGLNPRIGFWRDTHLGIRGPAVLQLQQVFAEDWFYATGEELSGPEWYPIPETMGDHMAQVVPGGPYGGADAFHHLFFAAINEAENRITLATSFFVPTPPLVTALETAAYRGVSVRLMLAGKPDIRGMLTAGRAFYDTLLESGVEIYEYQEGLQHAKTLTIDGRWSLVGSPNFDSRSVLLNFEVAVAFDSPALAEQLEDHFVRDCLRAKKIDPATWNQRGMIPRIAEQAIRLFSPIL